MPRDTSTTSTPVAPAVHLGADMAGFSRFLEIWGVEADLEYARAVGWVVRNRMRQWGVDMASALHCPWQPAGWRHSAQGVTRLAVAMATLALTQNGPDPTGGAVAFHHHQDGPDWALALVPHALIGPCFFYHGPHLSLHLYVVGPCNTHAFT